jgi:hypothetical protein
VALIRAKFSSLSVSPRLHSLTSLLRCPHPLLLALWPSPDTDLPHRFGRALLCQTCTLYLHRFLRMASLIALMMEAVQTSETLVNSYQSTWRYNPEDSHLHSHCCENLKSYLCHNVPIIKIMGMHGICVCMCV